MRYSHFNGLRSKTMGLLALMTSLLLTTACPNDPSDPPPDDPDAIATDAEILRFCSQQIPKIETDMTADERSALDGLETTVTTYDFTPIEQPDPDPTDPEAIVPYMLTPSDPADLFRMVGALAMGQGQRQLALWASLMGTQLQPANPKLLSQVGVVLTDLERCDEALTFLRKAKHDDDGKDAMLLVTLSEAEHCQHNLTRAREEAKQALALEPDNRLIQQHLSNLYIESLDPLADYLNTFHDACEADVNQALQLNDPQERQNFVQLRQQLSSQLANDLLTLYTSMPLDLPEGYLESQDDHTSNFQEYYSEDLSAPLQDKVLAIQNNIANQRAVLSQNLSDCCNGGSCACSCFYDLCAGSWAILEDQVDPRTYEALGLYAPDVVDALRDYELNLIGDVVQYSNDMTSSSVDWTLRYSMLMLTTQCNTVAMEIASALGPLLDNRPLSQADCELEPVCADAEIEAAQAAMMQRIEAERQAAAEAALRLAYAAQKAKDDTIKGELCLDGLGCLGVENGKFSVKIGTGPFSFAQFSVDTDKLSLGVRLGIGISDPTGNLSGADISFGGEIGPGTSSLDISSSFSFGAGTRGHSFTLVKLSN